MKTQIKIDILLATFEGERFLKEQLDSLFDQTHTNFHLIVRDDFSKDSTLNILEAYSQRHPSKITIVNAKKTLGVKENFSELMHKSNAPYVMFCDQDDVWLPEKIEKTLKKMIEMESLYSNHPLLIHTDLAVVDENLSLQHPSFWSYVNISPIEAHPFNRLLNQNVVTGCTVMVNRLLMEIAKPIPLESFMHDWWLALVASAFGKIGVINESLIYYRQHGKNTLGAQKFGNVKKIKEQLAKIRKGRLRNFEQALKFYHRYQDLLDNKARVDLKVFLSLSKKSWLQKRMMILKYGFYKEGFLRNLADFILG